MIKGNNVGTTALSQREIACFDASAVISGKITMVRQKKTKSLFQPPNAQTIPAAVWVLPSVIIGGKPALVIKAFATCWVALRTSRRRYRHGKRQRPYCKQIRTVFFKHIRKRMRIPHAVNVESVSFRLTSVQAKCDRRIQVFSRLCCSENPYKCLIGKMLCRKKQSILHKQVSSTYRRYDRSERGSQSNSLAFGGGGAPENDPSCRIPFRILFAGGLFLCQPEKIHSILIE